MVESVTKNMTPKSVRMSMVALSAAVMVVVWSIVDHYLSGFPNTVAAGVTALVMLISQFYDFKAVVAGDEVFEGES